MSENKFPLKITSYMVDGELLLLGECMALWGKPRIIIKCLHLCKVYV